MSFLFVKDNDKMDPQPFDKLTQCMSSYIGQCNKNFPYICSDGLLKGGCATDPNTWQQSRMCNRFCDVRRPLNQSEFPKIYPLKDVSKQIKCPKKFQKVCESHYPYQCTSGIAVGGCTDNPQFWQNSESCTTFCDISDGQFNKPSVEKIDNFRKSRNFLIKNNHYQKIWIGLYGKSYIPQGGGFELEPKMSQKIIVPSDWIGKIWGRTGCKRGISQDPKYGPANELVCESGNCNGKYGCSISGSAPVSIAEFFLSNSSNILDKYRVDLSNGYNLPIIIKPITIDSIQKCKIAGCQKYQTNNCPPELTVKGEFGTYCTSVCDAVRNPEKVLNPKYITFFDEELVCCDCACGSNCECDDRRCKFGCDPSKSNFNSGVDEILHESSPLLDGAKLRINKYPADIISINKSTIGKGGTCQMHMWPKASNGSTYSEVFKNQCENTKSWKFDNSNVHKCVNADYEIIFG